MLQETTVVIDFLLLLYFHMMHWSCFQFYSMQNSLCSLGYFKGKTGTVMLKIGELLHLKPNI